MSTINQEKETIKQQVMTFLSKNEQFNRRYPTTPIEVAWHSEGIRSEFSAEFEAWRMQCIQQAGLTIQQDVVVEASVAACELMLPGWSNNVRGVPNSILRGALFGVVKRGNRRYLKGERLASLSNINVIYTGERLDQSDLDVWEGGLHFARKFPLGNRVEFTDKEFLRTIDRSTGKTDREWLLSVARRLSSNTVELKLNRYTYGGSLLGACPT